MDYAKYDGHKIEEFATYDKENSWYCHNYYIDNDTKHIIYEVCDDDNYSYYRDETDNVEFAEAFFSEGEILHVYSEFLIDDK